MKEGYSLLKNRMQRTAAGLTAIFLCAALALPAAAEEAADEYDYAGKDAGQVIDETLEEMNVVKEYLGIAYENTVTGEICYRNADRPITAASLYKVPLCMYWTEKVADGELAWEDHVGAYQLERAVSQSLIYSNNKTAGALISGIGSYRQFRAAVAPLYGLNEEEASARDYLGSENITAQQMLHCLEMLYAEPERYPRVIDYLKEAEPDSYFRYYEDRFPIAQKYGFLSGHYTLTQNTAGILYTDDPFLLVVMSEGGAGSMEIIGRLAQRLCDYTQHVSAERNATPTPSAAPTPSATPAPTSAPTAAPTPSPVSDIQADAEPVPRIIPAAIIVSLAAVFLVPYAIRRKKEK